MPVQQKVMVGAVLVLAHAGLDHRRILQSRKPLRDVLPRGLERGRRGPAVAVGRIERCAARVVGDLETATPVARNPVHEARDFAPDGEILVRKAVISSGRAEEEDVLARRSDDLAEQVGKDPGEPRPAREDEEIRRKRRSIRQLQLLQRACPDLGRRDGNLAILAAFRGKSFDNVRAGATRRKVSGFFLEKRPANVVELDLGISLDGLGLAELLIRESALAKDRHRFAHELSFVGDHPESAGALIKLLLPALLSLVPERKGTRDHLCVDAVGPVNAPNDPSLPPRGSARVARTPSVDERHASSAAMEKERRPSSEGSRSNDYDSRTAIGF